MSAAASQSRPKALQPDLEATSTLHISNITCFSPLITPSQRYCLITSSKRYRLGIGAEPGALNLAKSSYIHAQSDTQTWEDPFGAQFSITRSSSDHQITISLVQRHFGGSGDVVGLSVLDTSLEGTAIELPLLSLSGEEIGRIKCSISSSLTSKITVTTDPAKNVDESGSLHISEPFPSVQVTAAPPNIVVVTASFDTGKQLLGRLDTLIQLDDTITQIHPYVRFVRGVVSVVDKVASSQNTLDDRIKELLSAMNSSCSFADDSGELKSLLERFHMTICQILKQVMECAYFIRDYCEDKPFATQMMENLGYTVDAQIDGYKANLAALQQALASGSPYQALTLWSRPHVLDIMTDHYELNLLKDMEYAREAHPNFGAGCLTGTRTEIIEALLYWGLGAEAPSSAANNPIMLPYSRSSRILWLCGTLGTGKTSIMRSTAAMVENMGCRRVYYGFDNNQPKASIGRLFSTIARDLADLDPAGKRRLVELLKEKTELRTTGDCELQFQQFIVNTAVGVTGVGETVIFIDGFDESGSISRRKQLLHILTQRALDVPPGLRIIVTSRYERDVQEALESPLPGVDVMRMQDIAEPLTFRDIAKYVKFSLRNVKELREERYQAPLDALVRKAGTSFQWAATACRFIEAEESGGADPREQLENVLQSDQGLDALYTTIMLQNFNPSDVRSLARLKSVLGRILSAQEPLPLSVLTQLLPPASVFSVSTADFFIQQRIVRFLGSLLSGTHDDNTPIMTLHASFREFLYNSLRSGVFYVDEKEAHELMAFSCFRVMDSELEFNICRIPTSFFPNHKIQNIDGLVHQHISLPLSYASRNWSFHVSEMHDIAVAVNSLLSFFREKFLKWLEVMSLTQTDSHGVLTALTMVKPSLELSKMKEDAIQFVSMFGPVILQSVPHIYLSTMAFIPTCSEHYDSQCAVQLGGLQLLHGRLDHWPNLHAILKGHTSSVTSITFSPNGLYLASGSRDNTVRIWDAKTGASVGPPLEGHTDAVASIAFSPDGLQLASASHDKTIRLWDVKMGASVGPPLEGHTDMVTSIAFSPNGLQLASASWDSTVRIWDAKTGASVGPPLAGHISLVCRGLR